MQVSFGLKGIERVETYTYVTGWKVTFNVVVEGGNDFDVPVFVAVEEATDLTLIKVAQDRLHEVASSLAGAVTQPD